MTTQTLSIKTNHCKLYFTLIVLVVIIMMSGCTVARINYPVLSNHTLTNEQFANLEIVDLPESEGFSQAGIGIQIPLFLDRTPKHKDFLSNLDKHQGAVGFVDVETKYSDLQIIPFLVHLEYKSLKANKILVDKTIEPVKVSRTSY